MRRKHSLCLSNIYRDPIYRIHDLSPFKYVKLVINHGRDKSGPYNVESLADMVDKGNLKRLPLLKPLAYESRFRLFGTSNQGLKQGTDLLAHSFIYQLPL